MPEYQIELIHGVMNFRYSNIGLSGHRASLFGLTVLVFAIPKRFRSRVDSCNLVQAIGDPTRNLLVVFLSRKPLQIVGEGVQPMMVCVLAN